MRIGARLGAFVLVVAAIGPWSPACAQAVEAVHRLMDLVATNRDIMNDAAGRLRPLVLAGNAHEAGPVQSLLQAVAALDARVEALAMVGSVLEEMKSPEDLAVARSAFRRAARRTFETANDQLDFMNEGLRLIKSPDAEAQGVLARDAVRAVRDAVKPFTARE